jgi:hypothetical protein
MSDEEYSKYITLKQRTIEEHALLMVKDFLQMMKNPEARKLFEALNFYKDDRKYLLD